MSVELIYLEDIAGEYGIQVPEFIVCEGTSGLFSMLRPQYLGCFKYNNISGPYIEGEEMDELCIRTIQTARDEGVDLFLTPEYAFSYNVLDKIIYDKTDQFQPEKGKLWCVCCQGIAVNKFLNKFNEYNEVCHVIDKAIITMEKKEFVNALLYIFRDNENKLVLLPQIKTHPMADGELHCEGSGLSRGKIIYKIGKDQCNQICAIICADAFQYNMSEINLQELKKFNESMIFLHPQLNAKPRHDTFAALRKMAYNLEHYKDLIYITANWADGTRLINDTPELGVNDLVINNPWTSIYIKDTNGKWFDSEISLRDGNFQKGIGFGYYKSRKLKIWYSFKDELMQEILLKKPRYIGPVVTEVKKDVSVKKVYQNENSNWIEKSSMTYDDNLAEVISVNIEDEKYNFPIKAKKQIRDLFFGLSIGTYETGQLMVDDNELHQNLGTFTDYDSELLREESAANFRRLVTILQGENLPNHMKDLIKNHQFAVVDNVFNLKSDSEYRAIVAFVPKVNDARQLCEAYEKIVNRKYMPNLNGTSVEQIETLKLEYEKFEKNKVCVMCLDDTGFGFSYFPKVNENITNPEKKQDETSIMR